MNQKELIKENIKLKKRIDKSIERIKKLKCYNFKCPSFEGCQGADRKYPINRDKLVMPYEVLDILEDVKKKDRWNIKDMTEWMNKGSFE